MAEFCYGCPAKGYCLEADPDRFEVKAKIDSSNEIYGMSANFTDSDGFASVEIPILPNFDSRESEKIAEQHSGEVIMSHKDATLAVGQKVVGRIERCHGTGKREIQGKLHEQCSALNTLVLQKFFKDEVDLRSLTDYLEQEFDQQ